MYNVFMENEFIKIKEAADMLGVTTLTLRNWDKQKKLVSYRHPFNNYRLYKTKDIHSLIKQIELNKGIKARPVVKEPRVYKLQVKHLDE